MYFPYGEGEILYLQKKDKRLGEAIDKIGKVNRQVNPDLFASVVHQIVGQQISTAAQVTIWQRICERVGEITPQNLCAMSQEELQANGISFRKADYIKDFAQLVHSGSLDLDKLHAMSDAQVIEKLSSLRGIGVWTAEMLMLFSMERPDILSYGDLAILRGMRMLYRHKEITKPLFERYRKRYSPYGSTASLYLWAIAGGAIEGLTDCQPKTVKKGSK